MAVIFMLIICLGPLFWLFAPGAQKNLAMRLGIREGRKS
jgi:cbb3-type cytochrome oxidase subunit 3